MAGFVDQGWIFFWSTGALVLSYSLRNELRRWAPIVGLIAQPAWYYSTWVAHQWGALALSVLITGCHIYGIRNLWFKKKAPVKGPFDAVDGEGRVWPIKCPADVSTSVYRRWRER